MIIMVLDLLLGIWQPEVDSSMVSAPVNAQLHVWIRAVRLLALGFSTVV